MHITEFIGIYLVIFWDKINSFCGRFRAHAQESLRWLAWEPHCRADESKHSEGRYWDAASAMLESRSSQRLAQFLNYRSAIATAIDKCVEVCCFTLCKLLDMHLDQNFYYSNVRRSELPSHELHWGRFS